MITLYVIIGKATGVFQTLKNVDKREVVEKEKYLYVQYITYYLYLLLYLSFIKRKADNICC